MADKLKELNLQIIQVESEEYLEEIKKLFIEYSEFLGFDLCFQNFKEELASLPGKYSRPEGCLLLALYGDNIAGCVALRKIEPDVCEMKRLYTRPEFRGKGIGKQLAINIIDEARKMKYKKMRLDTVSFLKEAISLYKSLGFNQIDSYCYNPREDVIYMELDL